MIGDDSRVRYDGIADAGHERRGAQLLHRCVRVWADIEGLGVSFGLGRIAGSFVNFVERIGAMFAGMAAMVSPRPIAFPPGHPRHGTIHIYWIFRWRLWRPLTRIHMGRRNDTLGGRREEPQATRADIPVHGEHGRHHHSLQGRQVARESAPLAPRAAHSGGSDHSRATRRRERGRSRCAGFGSDIPPDGGSVGRSSGAGVHEVLEICVPACVSMLCE
jgi:hypothetical protein